VDTASAVALGLVALAVAIAVWRHRRGGLRLDVRLWWGEPPGEDRTSDEGMSE
jgi:hypothetical protein